MKIILCFLVQVIHGITTVQGLLCYFCQSDYRKASDDCVKVSSSTRRIQCLDVEECIVGLHRDDITGKLTGEIIRDCKVHSRKLQDGEYQSCIRDKCNDFNYPRDRLECQQCRDCDILNRDPELCRRYSKYHSACYSYIDHETSQLHRGCQTDPDDTYCDDGNTNCVYCMSDDCNRDPRQRHFSLRCYHCTEEADSDCFIVQDYTNIRTFSFPVNMGKAFYCWTIFAGVNKGVVLRLHEFLPAFSTYFDMFCGREGLSSPQCVRCFGHLCNTHFEYGNCYECLEGGSDCDHKGRYLTPVSCEKNYVDNFGCYGLQTQTDDAVALRSPLRRGCITDLDYLHQKSCAESEFCFFCRSNYCNQRDMKCFKCTEIVEPGLMGPNFLHNNVTAVPCLRYDPENPWPSELCGSGDNCFLRIQYLNQTNQTLVERGCMGSNVQNSIDELWRPGLFELCNFKHCNDWDQLNGTHFCYNVTGGEIQCGNVTNRCFTAYYLTAKGEPMFEKGCYNPLDKFHIDQLNCDKHIQTCSVCGGSLCNDEPTQVKMRLKCETCNDREKCMFYDVERPYVKCRGLRNFFETETCFYGLDPKSRNVTRGCTMEAYPGRLTPPSHLLYCANKGCNSPSVNDYQCFQCDSNSRYAVPGSCFMVKGPRKEHLLKTSPCLGLTDFNEHEKGCYTYLTPTRILKRGCIRHMTDETISFCKRDQTHCKLCYTEGCNGYNINGVKELSGRCWMVVMWAMIFCICSEVSIDQFQ